MYPTFEKIREMAAGDYKRIPICKELYADSYTPVEMMRFCKRQVITAICWKVPARSEVWAGILFWDMTLPWKSPVQTESCEFENQ